MKATVTWKVESPNLWFGVNHFHRVRVVGSSLKIVVRFENNQSEGYYENNNLEVPQNVDWNFIATILYIGKFMNS